MDKKFKLQVLEDIEAQTNRDVIKFELSKKLLKWRMNKKKWGKSELEVLKQRFKDYDDNIADHKQILIIVKEEKDALQ
jgi:hypothetical protein